MTVEDERRRAIMERLVGLLREITHEDHGGFYSVIEIDRYSPGHVDGAEWMKRAREAMAEWDATASEPAESWRDRPPLI